MNLRAPGSVLLISCYELGHQPRGAALPLAFLQRAGFAPEALDIAVERFEADKVARARLVGISVPCTRPCGSAFEWRSASARSIRTLPSALTAFMQLRTRTTCWRTALTFVSAASARRISG